MTVATNTRVYRTDEGVEYRFDGTRWLSHQFFSSWSAVGLSATTDPLFVLPVIAGYAMYLDQLDAAYYVTGGTALDASNKWVVQLLGHPADAGAPTVFATVNIASGDLNEWLFAATTPTHVFGAIYYAGVIRATKTGTPGPLSLGLRLRYRKIGA